MARIIFPKSKQKEFLDLVLRNLNSPSLRSLLQFGISTNYSTLKNLYTERRSIHKELFLELCLLSKIDINTLNFQEKKDSWGQTKGGKIGRRKKF